ncbi:MAG: efflux RND transporter permease subunit [Mobilicoccus sp.]|nr:efflux RND transporter permease subunit [Mobilicoccus sp.]
MILTRFSLRNRALIALITVFTMIAGMLALTSLRRELIPSLEIPIAAVVTVVPGASPGVVEDRVTAPIEAAVLGIQGVERVESTSGAAISTVTVNLEYGTDLPGAQARIQRAVLAVQGLPDGAEPRVITGSVDDFPVMQIAVSGGTDADDLAARVNDLVVPLLSDVEGVREVQVSGVADKIVRIDLDDDAMSEAGITPTSVGSLLQANGIVVPGGTITEDQQDLGVEVGSRITTVEELRALPLAALPNGGGFGGMGGMPGGAGGGAAGGGVAGGAAGGNGAAMPPMGAPGGMSVPVPRPPQLPSPTPPTPDATPTPTPTPTPTSEWTRTAEPTAPESPLVTPTPPTLVPTALPTDLPTQLPGDVTWPEGLPSLTDLVEQLSQLPQLLAALQQLEQLQAQLQDLDGLRDQLGQLAQLQEFQDQLGQLSQLQDQLAALQGLEGQLGELRALQGQLTQLQGLQGQLAQLSQLQGQLAQLGQLQGQLEGLNALQGQLGALQGLQAQLAGLEELQRQLSAMQPGATEIPTPTIYTLGDVASVDLVDAPGAGVSRADGRPAVTLAITKLPAAGAVEVSHAVHDMLDEAQSQIPGGQLSVVFDQAPFIEQSIEDLGVEGLMGLAMAVLVVFVFLLSVPLTLVTALSIPMSLLMAMIGMWVGGLTLNILTLGALTISVGRVVDDSIVVIENIKRHLDLGETKTVAIPTAVKEVAAAITASTAATIAVFLPIGVVGGQAGELFRPFALTVALAMGTSLLVALTIIPVLGYWFIRADGHGRHGVVLPWRKRRQEDADAEVDEAPASESPAESIEPDAQHGGELDEAAPDQEPASTHEPRDDKEAVPGAGPLITTYMPALRFALARPLVVVLAAALLLVATGIAATNLRTDFIGDAGGDTLTVRQELPAGSSIERTDAAAQRIEALLAARDDVVSSQVTIAGSGGGFAAFFGGGSSNIARHTATIAEDVTPSEVADEIRAAVEGDASLGEITVSDGGAGGPGASEVEVSVQAADPDDLRAAADAVERAVASVDGARDVTNNLAAEVPSLVVDVNRAAALERGLTEPQIGMAVSRALQGSTIGRLEIDGQRRDVVVRDGEAPETPAQMRDIVVGSDLNGNEVLLETVAAVQRQDAPASISRVDGRRTALITAVPDGDDLGGLTRDITEAIDALDLPEGASAEIGGVSAEQQDAFTQLGLAMLIAIALIYVLLVATFNSLIQPLILLVSIPLAATGALLALEITDTPLGVPALIGLLMLIGIVVTNAIVLIDLVNQYRDRGYTMLEAVTEGARDRVRPIVMTALATMLALVPMALALSGGGAFISQPLAVVVIGGLFSSTALTLLVVPALYVLIERRRARREESDAPDERENSHNDGESAGVEGPTDETTVAQSR